MNRRPSVPLVPRQQFVEGAGQQVSVGARYFQRENAGYLAGWNPALREARYDVSDAWLKGAARAIEAAQNSGFIAGALQTLTDFVVGSGLRMASRPKVNALGWDAKTAQKFSRDFEERFTAWAKSPIQCDAAGQMNFGQMQQAVFGSYLVTGEALGFMPMIRRPGSQRMTKVMLIPSQRLSQKTNEMMREHQGVRVDGYGLPIAYEIKVRSSLGWVDEWFPARDRDGRTLVFHIKEPIIGSTRNVSPLAPVLKVIRQYDQVFDAVVTKKLTQAMFAAIMRTNIQGLAAFDGLFTDKDNEIMSIPAFAGAKGEWYEESKLDLGVHGRIAHLFPNDDLEFVESKGQGELQDKINEWLLREFCRGLGITYETGSNDFNGATYSSIRMGSAIEWAGVVRRRQNIIVPFCEMAAAAFLEEEIGTGRMEYPGGYRKFLQEREYAGVTSWTGPAKPQADDFKTARAYEVRKSMGTTTLDEIAAEYGRDWDDDMRQRKAENDLADELGLPRPHAPTDPLETPEGQALELNAPPDAPDERKPERNRRRTDRNKNRKSGVRPEGEPDERKAKDDAEAELSAELADDLDGNLEAELMADEEPKADKNGED